MVLGYVYFLILASTIFGNGMSDFPPGFRPANAIPDEFFTCVKRAPGFYADDKRSCVLYWSCQINGTHLRKAHGRCKSGTVFDDRVKSCIKSDKQSCPIDYGYFQSAASFCRGRPYPVPSLDSSANGQPIAQAYFANRLNNCDSYFWCYLIDGGQSRGFEFKCPLGEKFDEPRSLCRKEDQVECPISHGADLA